VTPKSILIFILLAALSYGGIFWIRAWLQRRQMMDRPNQRSSHSVPTPRGGGLGIVILTLLTALVFGLATQTRTQGMTYIAAGALLAWLGWRDDVKSLSSAFRFLIQAIAASLTMLGLGYFQSVSIPLAGELHFGMFGIPLTFLWIIGLTNAYNFMDGIDGMSGGVALAGGLGWMLLSAPNGGLQNDLAFWVALGIAASSLGFLGHNWSPARVFMGDVCSTFLGYSFAVLPLLSARAGGDALLLGTTVMWAFILDTSLTFFHRAFRGENVFAAHLSHLYQRLVSGGHPQAAVSTLYILLTLLGSVLAIGWVRGYAVVPFLILVGLPVLWFLLSWYAARKKNVG
jgi:UDP-N-acetylmuramyl pentapeptide phosphotransferase/UDP-N-acetylglucosamine-1-phosphate transferase